MADPLASDPLGILESGRIPVRSQPHFDVGDGWEIILPGEEIRRAKSLQRMAITRAEITFSSEENLQKFEHILQASDAGLSSVPDSEVLYDWQLVRRKGLTVRFGVSWYDADFYARRRDAYKSTLHEGIFKRVGVSPEAVRLEHIPL